MSDARLTRYDRWMYTTMNRRVGARLYATEGRRRVLVGVHAVLTGAFVTAWFAAIADGSKAGVWAMAALLLPWCTATGAINAATRGLLELRRRALDERQRGERSEVLARAHRITTALLLATVVAVGGYGLGGGDLTALTLPVLLGALVTHWLMPMWVAGLRVRDEPAEE
ncbi:hypothetical protein ACGFW5_34070 [Streptomyces sp. NPDC048416]|uniref:hypothetical protein n=1 Tax=Streptomyces sp. NPDC048416 TaxID=3365546 RepID=UPI003711F790